MIFNPSKIFPCDCMGEGITVTSYTDAEDMSENEVLMSEDTALRDCEESPFIQLSFWEYGVSKKPRWNFWWRLRIAWRVFWEGSAWPDMVIMKAKHAKNFANHILYTISKAEKEMKLEEGKLKELNPNLIIDDTGLDLIQEQPHAMYCAQHGGSAACELSNRKYGFTCPRC